MTHWFMAKVGHRTCARLFVCIPKRTSGSMIPTSLRPSYNVAKNIVPIPVPVATLAVVLHITLSSPEYLRQDGPSAGP